MRPTSAPITTGFLVASDERLAVCARVSPQTLALVTGERLEALPVTWARIALTGPGCTAAVDDIVLVSGCVSVGTR